MGTYRCGSGPTSTRGGAAVLSTTTHVPLVIATDVDNIDTTSFIFSIVTPPTNITDNVNIATPTYSSGTFTAVATYKHDGSETTSDSFTYKANDGSVDSNISTANVTITPVNDPPILIECTTAGLCSDPDSPINTQQTDEDIPDTLILSIYDPDTDAHIYIASPSDTINITTSMANVTADSILILSSTK